MRTTLPPPPTKPSVLRPVESVSLFALEPVFCYLNTLPQPPTITHHQWTPSPRSTSSTTRCRCALKSRRLPSSGTRTNFSGLVAQSSISANVSSDAKLWTTSSTGSQRRFAVRLRRRILRYRMTMRTLNLYAASRFYTIATLRSDCLQSRKSLCRCRPCPPRAPF
ncbi:hypothetical protein BD626DRAFT_187238 [Schizophyllum amplum]|uniref:Uncharacterized protein n=1 Tax=Schizophyllum amplum TaxID=97359 RepID=A0A550C0L1_9AGAR|nr:hypothetical protein BD626DRAFT_187238 [Auriculariopsis ampla]